MDSMYNYALKEKGIREVSKKVGNDWVLEEDMRILSQANIPYSQWKGCSFLVTGATGLIGSLTVKALLYISRKYNLQLRVIAPVRNMEKAQGVLREVWGHPQLIMLNKDLQYGSIEYDGEVDYIVHAAAVTTSKMMVSNPVETIKTTLNGTMAVLDFAVNKRIRGMVYLSSMEVYGIMDGKEAVTEKDLGYVNLQTVRSCYPEGKRMCECMCTAYSDQYGLPVCAIRLAQTFGAGVSAQDNRVFAQFAKSVIDKTDIVLHTDGLSEGNYVYTRDALKAIFLLLDKGVSGEVYNVVNESSHTTIKAMAEMVAEKVAVGRIKVIISPPADVERLGYAPKTKLRLSAEKITALGWSPEVDLEEAYRRLIKSLEGNIIGT